MSKSSEGVKTWRQNTKRRMVQAMGGKCAECGYNGCVEALDFHHKNPKEKEYVLGDLVASPQSWMTIVTELKKCVMLCANCHREVHAGLRVVANDARGFDSVWEDYRKVEAAGRTSICPQCGSSKRPESKHCSLRCASEHQERFDWTQYDLGEMLSTMSKIEVATKIGITSAGLSKRLMTVRKCLFCGNPIATTSERYCSLNCLGKSNQRVKWDQHNLFELMKTMSKSAIGRMLGVSEAAVRKRLAKIQSGMAPVVGVEPTSFVLTARRSAD